MGDFAGIRGFSQNPAGIAGIDQNLAASVGASGLNIAALDISDPEALFQFFSAQMTEAKGRVATMMQDQQKRNDDVKTLQGFSATLTKWENSGVPADPKAREEFFAAAEGALKVFPPDSSEAKAIRSMVDEAKAAGTETRTYRAADDKQSSFAALNQANSDRSLHQDQGATVTESKDAEGYSVYTVTWSKSDPITADKVKSVMASVKAYTDGLTTSSSMEMIRIQTGVERMTQITNLCSNILKKQDDAESAVIGNLR